MAYLEIYCSNDRPDYIRYDDQDLNNLQEFFFDARIEAPHVRTQYRCLGPFPELIEKGTPTYHDAFRITTKAAPDTLRATWQNQPISHLLCCSVYLFMHPKTDAYTRRIRLTFAQEPAKQLKQELIDFGVEIIVDHQPTE